MSRLIHVDKVKYISKRESKLYEKGISCVRAAPVAGFSSQDRGSKGKTERWTTDYRLMAATDDICI